MLEQILDYIHNWFVHDVYTGTFTITGGVLQDVNILDGQYFRIKGSIFNDGLHLNDSLADEVFTGEVWGLAVPPTIIALADEVSDWMKDYGAAVNSPYQSESFGGYSYSKASGGGGTGASGSAPYSWQSVFANQLNAYRKINNDFVL